MTGRTVRGALIGIPEVLLLLLAALAALSVDARHPTFQSASLTPVHIPGPCDHAARKPFTPTTADFPGIATNLPVIALGRDGDVPGVPSVGATHTVAFDAPGPHPGARVGLVRLNAHTWPNGGALGNQLLAQFDVGDVLMLSAGRSSLCYRVTERVEVDANADYDRFYELEGKPEFALIVCSGQRRGPGDWSKRTIWWGTPA